MSELVDGRYVFEYLPGAEADGLSPLVQFPDTRRSYVSESLPAFFVNRLMSQRREAYSRYLLAIGIDSAELNTPMEIFARTGGQRETDTFHLVDSLYSDANGRVHARFFASGVRHIPNATELISSMYVGQRLVLKAEPTNAIHHAAQLVCVDTGEPVGYVPDWLLDDLQLLQERSSEFHVFAERVNPDDHPHLRLMVRIEACAEDGES